MATDANLLPDEPSRRTTVMVAYRFERAWRLGAEIGRESVAGVTANVVGLR